MSTCTITAKTKWGIADQWFTCGAECRVYETDDLDIVFKLYDSYFDYQQVKRIYALNREYAIYGLAPQVYGRVIKIDENYGFFVERIKPVSYDDDEYSDDEISKLAIKLGIDGGGKCELSHNWGLTKSSEPVLYDFGLLTLKLIGIIDYE